MPSIPAPVAVVGLSCRLPHAPHFLAFWKLLESGGEAIGPPNHGRMMTLRSGANGSISRSGFLEDAASFDESFFGLSSAVAASLDPRQLLLLELAWEAFEDGGQKPEELRGSSTGVFAGAMWHSAGGGGTGSLLDHEAGMIPGRVSHSFGLRGPSLLVDTSTSSSLVAVHLACQSLRDGEIDLALAGGVSLFRTADEWKSLHAIGALSNDGRCRPFDRDASGYVRGEGGGLVLLKRLDDALRDGDRIYCVIRSGAINHNGQTSALPVPSPAAQRDLLDRAYGRLGLDFERIAYIEAHGTGTKAGDEAEWHALDGFFTGQRRNVLPIGSVKANIGHLEGAAGIAGLIKTALAAHRGRIPGTINVTAPRFPADGMHVLTASIPWPEGADYCGVTSLGLSGTNCHLVLSRPPEIGNGAHTAPPWLFVMSAQTEAALRQYAAAMIRWAEEWTDAEIPDVCYTAALRRSHHAIRRAFFVRSKGELVARLQEARAPEDESDSPARVFENGGKVDWTGLFPTGGRRLSLPPYPWQREGSRDRKAGEPASDAVPRLVADVLRVPAEMVDRGVRLIELGLDSLSAVELEAQLEAETGMQILAPDLLGPVTVSDLIRQAESAGRLAS